MGGIVFSKEEREEYKRIILEKFKLNIGASDF